MSSPLCPPRLRIRGRIPARVSPAAAVLTYVTIAHLVPLPPHFYNGHLLVTDEVGVWYLRREL